LAGLFLFPLICRFIDAIAGVLSFPRYRAVEAQRGREHAE